MINPSDIQLSTLPWVLLENRSLLPSKPCVYFAIDSLGVVQYIGRANNPKSRWTQHHRYKQLLELGSVRLACLFVDANLLPSVEEAMIQRFKPIMNGSSVPGGSQRKGIPVMLTLDPEVHELLKQWADNQRLPIATFAKSILEKEVIAAKARGQCKNNFPNRG